MNRDSDRDRSLLPLETGNGNDHLLLGLFPWGVDGAQTKGGRR